MVNQTVDSKKTQNSPANQRFSINPQSKNDKTSDKKPSCKHQHCSEYILSTLKAANQALNYEDFKKYSSMGRYAMGMSKLVKHGKILVLPRECPGRFILPEWGCRPEYSCVTRNDRKSRVGKFDFLSYLESLGWGSKLCVHNLKLTFQVYQLGWLGKDWEFCKLNISYRLKLSVSYPVSVQCFDSGTVLVSIGCSAKPFPLDIDGLTAMQSLLGEIRNALHAPCIPEPPTWLIAQWHLNRDSEKLQGGGLDVYLTFRDFFDDSAQFYYKHQLDKVRAEVSQSPKRTIQEVFENILNRDNASKGEN